MLSVSSLQLQPQFASDRVGLFNGGNTASELDVASAAPELRSSSR